jgi:hypothetical protein
MGKEHPVPHSLFESYLEITWDQGVEHVPLVAGLTEEQRGLFSITQEFWQTRPKQVIYRPEVEYSKTGEKERYLLHYKLEQHPELANYEVNWGTSRIEFKTGQDIPIVSWRNEGHKRFEDGAPVTVHHIDGDWTRDIENVKRLKRKQDPLRQALLKLYGACAITGEKTTQALEAAHVVDVKSKGRDCLSNALLLRADLHALFDRNMFNISAETGEICDISPALSEGYTGLLKGMTIPSDALKRIRVALNCRARIENVVKKSFAGQSRA